VGLIPFLLWWLKLGCATIGSILAVLCTFLRRLNLCHFFNHRLAHDRGRIFHGAVPWRSGDYEDGDKKQLHRKKLSSFGVTILIFSGLVSIPHQQKMYKARSDLQQQDLSGSWNRKRLRPLRENTQC
jgi:hypothetical protein